MKPYFDSYADQPSGSSYSGKYSSFCGQVGSSRLGNYIEPPQYNSAALSFQIASSWYDWQLCFPARRWGKNRTLNRRIITHLFNFQRHYQHISSYFQTKIFSVIINALELMFSKGENKSLICIIVLFFTNCRM